MQLVPLHVGQEESKKDALFERLLAKHGESEADLEAALAECVADGEEEDEEDEA
jgi:hypothetical protein